ncbi:hypothetical protein, partial [Paenibacillus macerans]|uniref:hypothetical protein n=1 Tax=Paenibacillus macerans TaxID=44252 RepID=UPI003D282E11
CSCNASAFFVLIQQALPRIKIIYHHATALLHSIRAVLAELNGNRLRFCTWWEFEDFRGSSRNFVEFHGISQAVS